MRELEYYSAHEIVQLSTLASIAAHVMRTDKPMPLTAEESSALYKLLIRFFARIRAETTNPNELQALLSEGTAKAAVRIADAVEVPHGA